MVFAFLLLSFKSSLYILDDSTLSDISFAIIFSRSVAYLLVLSVFILFIYFWLRWVFVAARGIFHCGARASLHVAWGLQSAWAL